MIEQLVGLVVDEAVALLRRQGIDRPVTDVARLRAATGARILLDGLGVRAEPATCCTLDVGHDGPCVWDCSGCFGTGTCPECEGDGPELAGCEVCDTTGTCPWCHGRGQFVDDLPRPRPLETITVAGGVL